MCNCKVVGRFLAGFHMKTDKNVENSDIFENGDFSSPRGRQKLKSSQTMSYLTTLNPIDCTAVKKKKTKNKKQKQT